jgi:hypothetical protein
VSVVAGETPRLTWYARKGRYDLRARFTGSKANTAAASGKVVLIVR